MKPSSRVVAPVKTGVQYFCNALKSVDSGACPGLRSGIHRNDDSWAFLTFGEFVNPVPTSFLFFQKNPFPAGEGLPYNLPREPRSERIPLYKRALQTGYSRMTIVRIRLTRQIGRVRKIIRLPSES